MLTETKSFPTHYRASSPVALVEAKVADLEDATTQDDTTTDPNPESESIEDSEELDKVKLSYMTED